MFLSSIDLFAYEQSYQKNDAPKQRASYKDIPIPDSFVAVDFETLNEDKKSVCSAGFVKYVHGKIVERRQYNIRVPKEFQTPGEWQKIHGISYNEDKSSKTFLELIPEWEEFIGDLPLAAQNCSVERNCFGAWVNDRETTIRWQQLFDSICESKRVESDNNDPQKGEGMHSLSTLCMRYGVSELPHHIAVYDAEMCGNVLLRLKAISENANEYAPISTKASKKFFVSDLEHRIDLDNIKDNVFKQKNITFTGFNKTDTLEYGHILWKMGAILKESLVKDTEIVICGNFRKDTTARKNAISKGIQIIEEIDLISIIRDYEKE